MVIVYPTEIAEYIQSRKALPHRERNFLASGNGLRAAYRVAKKVKSGFDTRWFQI